MNEVNGVRVRCTKDGISVEGARDIGSTNDTRAGSLSQFLRIAECWWNTYCEKSPQPDKGWKDICAKCNDGEIEPYYCAYYGEPNGCNSPIYGKHPTTKKSSAVGNAAAMREYAKMLGAVCFDCARAAGFKPKDKTVGVWVDECGICHKRKPCTDLHHDWKKKGEEK